MFELSDLDIKFYENMIDLNDRTESSSTHIDPSDMVLGINEENFIDLMKSIETKAKKVFDGIMGNYGMKPPTLKGVEHGGRP